MPTSVDIAFALTHLHSDPSAASALGFASRTTGGVAALLKASAPQRLSAVLLSSASSVSVRAACAAALADIAFGCPDALTSDASAIPDALISQLFATSAAVSVPCATALARMCASSVAVSALCAPRSRVDALAKSAVHALAHGPAAAAAACAALVASVASSSAPGCDALHRAGAVEALGAVLSGSSRGVTQSCAAAFLAFTCAPAPAAAVARLLSRAPALVSPLLFDENGVAALSALLALEGGGLAPTALLENEAVVSATLDVLSGARRGHAAPLTRSVAVNLFSAWTSPTDGLARLAVPPLTASARAHDAHVLALLAPHSAGAAALLAARPEDIHLLLRKSVKPCAALISLVAAGARGRKRPRAGAGAEDRLPQVSSVLTALTVRATAPDTLTHVSLALHSEASAAARDEPGCYTVLSRGKGMLPQTGDISVRAAGRWRSLLFDGTEQGLLFAGESGAADVSVLGLEYIRAMAAAGAAFVGAALRVGARPKAGSDARPRVICVGLGSGALPAFLAHEFPSAHVEVLEVDAAVTAVVRSVLRVPLVEGLRAPPRGLAAVRHADAAEWVASEAARASAPRVELICLDAYDRTGAVPTQVSDSAFFRDACALLAPGGALVANVWNGAVGSPSRARTDEYALSLMRVFGTGAVFSVRVARQQSNVVFVAVKSGSSVAGAADASTLSRPALAAAAHSASALWTFDAASYVRENVFRLVPTVGGGVAECVPGPEGTSCVDLALFSNGDDE